MDIILINGNIITMDEKRSRAQAVAVKDGLIQAVGTNEEVEKLAQADTQVIDLEGKTMIPGFNDSHLHMLLQGYNTYKFDCSNVRSIDDLIEQGRTYIKENEIPAGQWVLGFGWNQYEMEEQRIPNSKELDLISTEHPICLTRYCVHSTLANSMAMEIAGVTKDSPQPYGGMYDVYENGEPNGLFSENGRYMIYDHIPDPSIEEIKKMLVRAATAASECGVTSVQTDDFEALNRKDWRIVMKAYAELIEEKALPVRVYQQCLLPNKKRLQEFLDAGNTTGVGNEFYKVGPLKLLTDGGLGAHTALLQEPYTDAPDDSGIAVFTQDEINELAELAQSNGMQLLFHAIGDGAMYMCFDAFKHAQERVFNDDQRPGIVHCQVTDERLLQRFKEQDVIAFIEPITLNNDIHLVEKRLGADRLPKTYNYKRLFDDGVRVGISSDWPVDSINPLKNIYVGVTRKDYTGFPKNGWFPEQCLTVDEAMYGFTMGSAYCSYEEDVKGSIEIGKYADLAVLSEDIYAVEKDSIKDIQVEMTIMDGRIMHQL